MEPKALNSVQNRVEYFYSIIQKHGDHWYSKDSKFGFWKEESKWAWASYSFEFVANASFSNLQTRGFETRKAAAKYIDSIFDTGILQTGFKRFHVVSRYVFKGHNFIMQKEKSGWSIHSPLYGKITDGEQTFFSSRRRAIQVMVESHQHFLKMI